MLCTAIAGTAPFEVLLRPMLAFGALGGAFLDQKLRRRPGRVVRHQHHRARLYLLHKVGAMSAGPPGAWGVFLITGSIAGFMARKSFQARL